jgi:hypothetical protein
MTIDHSRCAAEGTFMRRAIWVGVVTLAVIAGTSEGMAARQTARGQVPAPAAGHITTPKEEFGHAFGDDYFLANYQQLSAYWRTLERESPRIKLQDIGKTAEGRTQLMAIVTSPENHRRLARYKEISSQLAHARGANGAVLTDAEARALAKEGKTVVWIDGGLHATEVLGAQQLGDMVYQFVSGTDDETMRILNDCIILFVHANPDGNDLTADWYMRNPDPQQRSMTGLPKLYQKYIGHDNNRDFFASTQAETENMNRVLYHEWFPQIVYNHHQSGPAGTILWSPPLRDPFNYHQDPLIPLGIQTVGLALHTRLAAEGKPGATSRNGGPYDGWWNGGLRNTAAFHNMIAILTEMIGNPTPQRVPFVLDRQIPSSDLEYPVPPTTGDTLWHFRQSIDYSVACNRGVLDLASKMRENFLFNIYRMGKNSIERGSRDEWTARPHRITGIAAANGVSAGGRGGANQAADTAVWAALHEPEDRDPRAFVIPSDQPDFLTAIKFINALRETGIDVARASRPFSVAGKTYPAGSFVINTNQAFRPHVLDMFEPQDHPDNFLYPGAPPTRPYDNAGWTLAYQMGVSFDRLFDTVTDPSLTPVTDWNIAPPPGRAAASAAGGYLLRHDVLDSVRVLNALKGHDIGMLSAPVTAEGQTFPVGTYWVDAASAAALPDLARRTGVNAYALSSKPAGVTTLAAPRIGVWDTYGGSIDAGWTRWILEQFEFPFTRVFAPELDAGRLNEKYDVLVFVGGALPSPAAGRGGRGGRAGGAPAGGGRGGGMPVPAEYAGQQGSVSADVTLPSLKAFVEAGGRIVAIGTSATNLAAYLDLPLSNHLVENGQPLPNTEFYAPGSVLRARVDTTQPAAYGMREYTDVFFDNSPVWTLGPNAAAAGVTPIAWFDSKTPLRSGWAWGQAYLDQGVIGVDAKVGQGHVLLYGAEILQRAQPHRTFQLLFNGLWGR